MSLFGALVRVVSKPIAVNQSLANCSNNDAHIQVVSYDLLGGFPLIFGFLIASQQVFYCS